MKKTRCEVKRCNDISLCYTEKIRCESKRCDVTALGYIKKIRCEFKRCGGIDKKTGGGYSAAKEKVTTVHISENGKVAHM